MIKITKKSKKNPKDSEDNIENFIKNYSVEFLKIGVGDYAEVYKFVINKNILVNTKILKRGIYAIKIYYSDLKDHEINKLILLSKYGLIPKIYIIVNHYIIMDYIDGYTLEYIKSEYFKRNYSDNDYWKIRQYIDNKIEFLKTIWDKLKFRHGDLNPKNIIISKNLKNVYLIDPWV